MQNQPTTFAGLVQYLIELVNLVIPVIFGLILLVIIWRVINAWVIKGGDQRAVDEGKQTVLIGVVVLVVLSGIWGILNILRASLFGL